jgi:hypothetical protein
MQPKLWRPRRPVCAQAQPPHIRVSAPPSTVSRRVNIRDLSQHNVTAAQLIWTMATFSQPASIHECSHWI